jgi:uncharacterized protein YndB with AHSA1/START domain
MKIGNGNAKVTLTADDEILITREFAAPPEVVYRAWTEPELVRRWWCGQRGTMTVCEIDLRVGGGWRYVMTTPDGSDVAFHGEYRELIPGERIVNTEVFEQPGVPEPTPDEAVLNVVAFAARGGRTALSLLMRTHTRELRDMILASGMEAGMQEQLDALDELAAALA